MDRRRFLRNSGLAGAGALLGPSLLSGCVPQPVTATGSGGAEYFPSAVPQGSMLDFAASESPIEHVVILMMENRSFDHYLGWLSADEGYHERGRRFYGDEFTIDARPHQSYLDPLGNQVPTYSLGGGLSPAGYRGCGYGDPDHGWDASRVQRDHGFLAEGANSDVFPLGYEEADDLPFHAAHGAALHHLRPLPLFVARPDPTEPSLPALGAVGRLQEQLPAHRRARPPVGHHLRPAQASGRVDPLVLARSAVAGVLGAAHGPT